MFIYDCYKMFVHIYMKSKDACNKYDKKINKRKIHLFNKCFVHGILLCEEILKYFVELGSGKA